MMNNVSSIENNGYGFENCFFICKPIMICLFQVILLFPSLIYYGFSITPEIKITENRQLASFPELSVATLFKLPGQIEAWWTDNFGFRKVMLRWNNLINMKMFNISPVQDVIAGKNGWLYYAGADSGSDHQGLVPFTDTELNKMLENLKKTDSWLKTRGIKYLIVIAPNKQTVYPQYLPGWARKSIGPTRLEQLTRALGKNHDIHLLDLREILMERTGVKDDYRDTLVYYKTDSHWNHLGAFLATQAITHKLTRDFPGFIDPLNGNININVSGRQGGDLAELLGMFDQFSDIEIKIGIESQNSNNKNNLKAVVFWDSYYERVRPFFKLCFKTVVEEAERARPFNYDLIEKEKPDFVLDIFVERFLKQRLLYR